jgi:hypothetical protein
MLIDVTWMITPIPEHGRQQRAIEPHRRHQVEIDLFLHASSSSAVNQPAGARPAEHVDDNVDAPSDRARSVRRGCTPQMS